MASPWKWFGIKSLFRTSITGAPSVRDEDYDSEGTLVEERVVLVRARSASEAIAKGEAEARAYCRGYHINPYGQRVTLRRLKVIESFELYDPPVNMSEIWSSTSVIQSSVTDHDLVDQRFGPDEPQQALSLRKKYLNRRFSGVVSGGG